ncbi:MAG: patatin-like phospholipase family protein [Chthoniobacteraceae bacterium]
MPEAAGGTGVALGAEGFPPHPLLSLLPPGTLERLLAAGAVDEYAKGTTIFRAGEPCDAIFLILSGRCELRRSVDCIDGVFGPGDLLGARSLLNREPHHTTAVVVTHAVLLRLPADELQNLFATDPSLAGRFSQSVTSRVEIPADLGAPRVRRIVALLPLENRTNAAVVAEDLAAYLRSLHHQSVLLLHLSGRAEMEPKPFPLASTIFGAEFCFARQRRTTAAGFDEVHLLVRPETRDTAAIAPLLSHCSRHYDFVLLQLAPETPAPAALEALIQSDLGYVLMQPSTQNLYDFRLLMRELAERSRGASTHVKPILFADDHMSAAEVDEHLAALGYAVHSIVRGFPQREAPTIPEKRYELAIHRIAREIARCRVGLALSSGAAKGLAHIGVIQVLEENGIEIDCIAGSSMGAYVGANWAYGLDGERLEKVAREVEGPWGLFRLIDPVLPPRRGFIRTRRTVARLRRSIDNAHFSQLVRPLRVVATHLDTLERVVFSSGEVCRAVDASIAMPGICVPVKLDGETYIDGGIADPLPVDVLSELGIEKIIAVNVIPPPERIRYWLDASREADGRAPRRNWLGRLADQHLNYLASGNILDTLMRAINGAQTRVAEASCREADVVLRPLSGDAVWHDFTKPQKYIALGRSVAEAQLLELKSLLGGPPHEPQIALAVESSLAA